MTNSLFNNSLSVSEFLSQINWQGLRKEVVTQTSATLADNWHTSLEKITVRTFFANCNWSGRSLNAGALTPTASLSMSLPVTEFFRQFAWHGSPQIASPIEIDSTTEVEIESDGLSMDEFSNLF